MRIDMIDKYEFKMQYFEESGQWLEGKRLNFAYEIFKICNKYPKEFSEELISPIIDQQQNASINNNKD